MAFSLASRVSAVGDAEKVRFLHLPTNGKTYFVYNAKTSSGTFQFYYKELPPLAQLTPDFFPSVGSEYQVGGEVPLVEDFHVVPDGYSDNIVCLYSDGNEIWRFIFSIVNGDIVEPAHIIFDGRDPVLVNGIDLYALYIKGSTVRFRSNWGSEEIVVEPSGAYIESFSAVAENSVFLRYTGSHARSRTLAPLRQADGYTDIIYVLTNLPPIPPVYAESDFHTGDTVSLFPSIPGYDPEGVPLVYSSGSLPPGLSIDSETGEIYGTITHIDQENALVTVTVQDNLFSSDGYVYLQQPIALGGNKTYINVGGTKYAVHMFPSDGSFTVNAPISAEYLVVGGGGGGGMDMGGGGGGGGVLTGTFSLAPGSYEMIVGAGGWGAPAGSSYRGDGVGPQPGGHEFTVPSTNGGPSAAFAASTADSRISLLLSMNGAEGGTSFSDASPYSSSVSVFGNAKTTALQSKFGGSSAVFDGNGDYLRLQRSAMIFDAADFTIEAWVRLASMPTSDAWPTNWSAHMVIAAVGTPSKGDGLGLMLGANNIILQSRDAQIAAGAHGMAPNTWYHVAATRNGNTIRLFVNGVIKATSTFSGAAGQGTFTYVGSETGEGAWLNGFLNDLRITKGLARYTAPFSPPVSQFTYNGGIVSLGGGGGGSSYYAYAPGPQGYDGGSGGGTSGYSTGPQISGGLGVTGQGNNGGRGGPQYYSGGGGGAGGVGTNSTSRPDGGPGIESAISGESYYWGGGGGGASYTLSQGGNGGIGGGGGGAVGSTTGGAGINPGQPGGGGSPNSQTNTPGGNGGVNTGGGGGGGSHYFANNKGGNGGSGIVIIRYQI